MFEAYSGMKCQRCGAILGNLECTICKTISLGFGSIKWFTTYLEALDVVRAIKFKKRFEVCNFVAEKIVSLIDAHYDSIIVSPINQRSFMEREVNHMWLICRSVSTKMGLPIMSPLLKYKNNNRIRVALAQNIAKNNKALFIDDVITSGETFIQSLKLLGKFFNQVDAIFFACSNPNIFSNLVFRVRLNKAWRVSK